MALDALREQILALVEQHANEQTAPRPFLPGVTPVPVSGRTYGAAEVRSLVESALEFWLTAGRFNSAFEPKLASFLGVRHVLTVNSGSSANLLAVAALASPEHGERALRPGDEVITVAAGFPTTVNPMIMYGLVPVFVDVEEATYNTTPDRIEAAVTPRTRAIMLAHTLGNPFDAVAVAEIAKRHDLRVVEDCCDALGSTLGGKMVGNFGDIGTLSFYPAHHITMGEGGAVFTQQPKLKKLLESIRDWGRDCWCEPGKDNTCGKRFDWSLGALPCGYDHKYTYSRLGYNLKITDMQAAVGFAQLDRVTEFIERRRQNFSAYQRRMATLEDVFVLPRATPGSDPAWFGYPLTIRPESGLDRTRLQKFLDERRIASRLIFGGNLTRQPYFANVKYRIASSLETTDRIMANSLWLGVFPGVTDSMIEYVVGEIHAFVRQFARQKVL